MLARPLSLPIHRHCPFLSIAITPASTHLPTFLAYGCSAGVATSQDGLRWARGAGDVAGARGAEKDADVGRVLAPNADWWWHDTRHLAVSDVQVGSGSRPGQGQGLRWRMCLRFEAVYRHATRPSLSSRRTSM